MKKIFIATAMLLLMSGCEKGNDEDKARVRALFPEDKYFLGSVK